MSAKRWRQGSERVGISLNYLRACWCTSSFQPPPVFPLIYLRISHDISMFGLNAHNAFAYYVPLHHLCFEMSSLLLLSPTTLGRGSTGIVRQLRHRPLFPVYYHHTSTQWFPPPVSSPGLQHKQSWKTETPSDSTPLTHINSEIASRLLGSFPYSTLAWLPYPYFSNIG